MKAFVNLIIIVKYILQLLGESLKNKETFVIDF